MQIFSIKKKKKNGTIAVKSRIDLRAVHLVAKHEIPATKRNKGINMLEKPYTEKRMSPNVQAAIYSGLFVPGPAGPKSIGSNASEIEKNAATRSKTEPVAIFSLFDSLIFHLSEN